MLEMSFSIKPCLEFQQTEGGHTIIVFWLLKLVFEHSQQVFCSNIRSVREKQCTVCSVHCHSDSTQQFWVYFEQNEALIVFTLLCFCDWLGGNVHSRARCRRGWSTISEQPGAAQPHFGISTFLWTLLLQLQMQSVSFSFCLASFKSETRC